MNRELTGKKRFRVHKTCFRPALVVLQVEVQLDGMDYDCGHVHRVSYKEWQDAKPEDLLTEEVLSL